MLKKSPLLITSLLVCILQAYGDSNGYYINLNSGRGNFTQSALNSGFAWSLNGGYQFNNYLAVDGGYTGIYTSQYNNGITLGGNLFDVAVKGILPLSNLFGLYGRIGGGYFVNGARGHINTSDIGDSIFSNGKPSQSASGLIGGGISLSINKSFEIHLEDSYITPLNNQVSNINVLSVGLQYNFSSSADTKTDTYNDVGIDNVYDYGSFTQAESKPNIELIEINRECVYIVVQKGNTLWSISQSNNVSIDTLRQLNGIIGDKIYVGARLKITPCLSQTKCNST